MNLSVRLWRSAPTSPTSFPARLSVERGMWFAAIAAIALQADDISARRCRALASTVRGVCAIHCPADDEYLAPSSLGGSGYRGNFRSCRERRSYCVILSSAGRGRVDYRRGPHRPDGGGGGAPCRCAICCRNRRESLSPGACAEDGRHGGGGRAAGKTFRRAEKAGHG